jgi:hypothetical protein
MKPDAGFPPFSLTCPMATKRLKAISEDAGEWLPDPLVQTHQSRECSPCR